MNKKINYLLTGLLISLFSLLIYSLSDGFSPTTDSFSNNLTAVSIVHNHKLDLTDFKEGLIQKNLLDVSTPSKKNQKIYSRTPILNGIFSAPFFYFSDSFYHIKTPSNDLIFYTEYYQIIGKRYAAVISAISVFIIYFIFLNLFKSSKLSVIGTIVFAFGSTIFSTASQGNWQHAPSALLISLTYYFLIKYFQNNKTKFLVPISLFLLISYLIRPVNITFIIALLLLLIFYKKFKGLIISLVIISSGVVGYRLLCNLIGVPNGYSDIIIESLKSINIFSSIKVFISLLISPNTGLFSFHPVFIFSFLGIFLFIKKIIINKNTFIKFPILLFSALNIIFIFGLNSIWIFWPGGISWGPRLLTEAIIPLILFLIFYFSDINKYLKLNKIIFFIFLIISIFNSVLGIYCNTGEWHGNYWNGRSLSSGPWEYKPTMFNYYIFNKRSFFIKKLYRQNNSIYLNTKTYLFHIPEKKIKLIYNQTDKYFDKNN